MRENLATITSKGQVTIPAAVRKHLKLESGDKILFVIEADGTVHLHVPRYPDLDSIKGAAGSLPKPMSWHEMRELAREDYIKREYLDKP